MKTRNDFRSHDEWVAFVRDSVPQVDVPYTIAMGLTEMYRRFYELRSQPFPERFSSEIERISAMTEPTRTESLEALNNTIIADMVQFLFTAAAGSATESAGAYPTTPREVIDHLLEHLRIKNPYFALWTHYRDDVAGRESAPEWREYLTGTMGAHEVREIEFAQLMSELGRCLDLYHQRELPLPKHFYFQIWFLHSTHGPERNPMTRALVQELVEGLEPCASA
jgi:hypothetical protein